MFPDGNVCGGEPDGGGRPELRGLGALGRRLGGPGRKLGGGGRPGGSEPKPGAGTEGSRPAERARTGGGGGPGREGDSGG
jgi:hypothetical protein